MIKKFKSEYESPQTVEIPFGTMAVFCSSFDLQDLTEDPDPFEWA